MRILITNIELFSLSGTTTTVRDLAWELGLRGHEVVVYTPYAGRPAREWRRAGLKITNAIGGVGDPPDIIHGHHSLPTILALARFPGVPAVWMSHGKNMWFDEPPKFDRIFRYVPIDTLRRDLLLRHGISADRMATIPLGVDIDRIPGRASPLPDVPRRVLAYTKTRAQLPTLVAACNRLGLEFTVLGRGADRMTFEPERVLVRQDIVFASGRSAIEALCCGAALIVGDQRGLAGLVTTHNYAALRDVNFGSMAMFRPFTLENVEAEIRKYDCRDAATVADRARRDADMSTFVDRLEALYEGALAERRNPAWSGKESQAVQRFLSSWPAEADKIIEYRKARDRLVAICRDNDLGASNDA